MKKSKTQTKTTTKNESSVNLEEALHLMIDWAFDCGDILNGHLVRSYTEPLQILDKGKHGLATEADLLSEKFVIDKIKKHYPDHQILSEEDSFAKKLKIEGVKSNEYVWLIDPLDGTNNFYNRVPFFCVSLALCKGKEAQVGVVYNPVNCELFYAIKGQGAFLVRLVGETEVKVELKASRKRKEFTEALLSANLTGKKIEKSLLKNFPEVRAMRRLGSAALELSYVAAGMLDAYWEYSLQPWDMGAAGLICQEAGVKISNLKGGKYHPFGVSVLASHPSLYPTLKTILCK